MLDVIKLNEDFGEVDLALFWLGGVYFETWEEEFHLYQTMIPIRCIPI